MKALELIRKERERQISKEGYDADHDGHHIRGELSEAAAAYAKCTSAMLRGADADEFPADMMVDAGDWPFEESAWKLTDDPIRNLVKAGALIVAELDRLIAEREEYL